MANKEKEVCGTCDTPVGSKKFHMTQTGISGFSAIVNSALFLSIILLLFQTREELAELRTTIVERYMVQERIIEDIDDLEDKVDNHGNRIHVIERDIEDIKKERK